MLNLKLPLTIRIPSPGGVKTATIRYPEDDMMDRRQKARSISVRSGGGRSDETLNESPALDAEIVREIQIDGDTLEPADCTWLLTKLSQLEITDGGRCEAGFYVELTYLGNQYRHELRTPSAEQIQKHRRESVKTVSGRYGLTTYTTHMMPGRALYDALFVKADGYPDGYIPIHHKANVITELHNLIDSEVCISNPSPSQA